MALTGLCVTEMELHHW